MEVLKELSSQKSFDSYFLDMQNAIFSIYELYDKMFKECDYKKIGEIKSEGFILKESLKEGLEGRVDSEIYEGIIGHASNILNSFERYETGQLMPNIEIMEDVFTLILFMKQIVDNSELDIGRAREKGKIGFGRWMSDYMKIRFRKRPQYHI